MATGMSVTKVVSSNSLGSVRAATSVGGWKWKKFTVKIEAGICEGSTRVLRSVAANMLRTVVPNIVVRFRNYIRNVAPLAGP
jgi:hypothetical protein